jgi:hypothetical protein
MDDLGLQVRNRFDTKMLWGACWGFIPNKGKSKHKLSHGRYAKSICRTFLGRFFWHPEGFPTLPARFVQTEHRFCVRCWVPHFKSLRDDFLKTVHLPKWYLRQTEILACAQKQLTSITCRWRGGVYHMTVPQNHWKIQYLWNWKTKIGELINTPHLSL